LKEIIVKKDTPEQARARDERYRARTNDHVARYVASDGKDGYVESAMGATNLLLTTVGRKSGAERTTPLNFAESDAGYVIIASYEGADTHPKWYLNIQANPNVTVQILGARFQAVAREVFGDEKVRLWPLLADHLPYFNQYQASTERTIPLLVLERAK
jgi:deazaflavin-dependent oxidoreductase (nitroreductase family)